MRTKNIKDILTQADRIRAGYGWKQRRDKWNYKQFMAIVAKLQDIQGRYIRAIGIYQREAEGMTREAQVANFDECILRQYPASIYAKQV